MRSPQPPSGGPSAGSRKVEPRHHSPSARKVEPRHHSPSDLRRKQARTGRIQTTARERQDAWLETGQPNLTYRLTRELGELYDLHRDGQAGTFTDPFYGRTMKGAE